MPSDKGLFQLQGKMAFGKHLDYGAPQHPSTTPQAPTVAGYVSALTEGSLLSPWQSKQLKCCLMPDISTLPPVLKHDPHLLLYLKFLKSYSLFDPSHCFPEQPCFPFLPVKKTAGVSISSKTDTFEEKTLRLAPMVVSLICSFFKCTLRSQVISLCFLPCLVFLQLN